MQIPDIVVGSSEQGPAFVMIGNVSFVHFVSILAASIIEQVHAMPKKKEEGTMPQSGAGRRLMLAVNWSDNGHINTLQVQVEFLYAWVLENIANPKRSATWLMSKEQILLITEALSEYQKYKTMVVLWGYEEHGPHFGESTAFNKMDWSDKNEALLALLEPQPS